MTACSMASGASAAGMFFVGPFLQQLVNNNIRVGLQRLVRAKHVWTHSGILLAGGAFGVRKSDTEPRFISDLPVNQLLDPDLIFIPFLRLPSSLASPVLDSW